MTTTRRLRFADVMIIAAACILGVAALGPAAQQAREVQNRIQCASNLKQIGLAMVMYANNETRNGMSFPRTEYKPDDPPKFFTNWKQPNSFGQGAPEANDVTAATFLLLKTQDISPAAFHCPDSKSKSLVIGTAKGGGDQPLAKMAGELSNFPGMDYISYSFQNPYAGMNALMTGWKWNVTLPQDFALAADLNPGKPATTVKAPKYSPLPPEPPPMTQANSRNHDGAGQNVLYADAHVEWQTTPFSGPILGDAPNQWRDNIYTARTAANQQTGGEIIAPAFDASDNILLPAADYKASGAK